MSRILKEINSRCSQQGCGVGAAVGVWRSRRFLGGVGFLQHWES